MRRGEKRDVVAQFSLTEAGENKENLQVTFIMFRADLEIPNDGIYVVIRVCQQTQNKTAPVQTRRRCVLQGCRCRRHNQTFTSADTDTILTSNLSVTASFNQHKFSHTCLDRTYKSRRVHAASLTYKVNIYSNDAAAADYLLSLIHETQPNLQRSNGHF